MALFTGLRVGEKAGVLLMKRSLGAGKEERRWIGTNLRRPTLAIRKTAFFPPG